MHVLRTVGSFAIALIALGAIAFAQTEGTPNPTPAKPDFSKMQFMTGTWKCSVRSSRRPGPYTTISTASIAPNGYWMTTKTMVQKASWIPTTFASEDRMTYDASTSRWVDISTDQLGGYDVSTSPGWKGRSIVWTDRVYPTANNIASNSPTTFTKVSDTKTTSANSFKEPSGRVVTVNTACTKT